MLLISLALPACATITHGPSETIQVMSEPRGALAVAICDGHEAGRTLTPGGITIRRWHDECAIDVSADGHERMTVPLEVGPSRRFWGNFILGGAAGASTAVAIGDDGGNLS